MRGLAMWMLAFLVLWQPAIASEPQRVRVGGYDFPPYLFRPESAHPTGLVAELLPLLNRLQSDYRFELVPTSASRRYRDMAAARFDLMFFEASFWGWTDAPHVSVPLPLEDAEVYVALAEPGRDQSYFTDFEGKRMALYRGYHYGFAGYNADPVFLGRRYRAQMTYSHDSNLRLLLIGRADVAVVTRSYLQMYADCNPESRDRFLVSQHYDQVYEHQVLLRPGGPLNAPQMQQLLQRLQASPEYVQLLQHYHLGSPIPEAGRL